MQIPFAAPDEEQQQTLGDNPPRIAECRSKPAAMSACLEFGHFRILLRRRELLANGVPVKLGTRAFDLLMVLIEAEGLLVKKAELLDRVWPGIVVSEDNLKVQVSELRGALAGDRDLIRTEFGRGYRFTGVVRRLAAAVPPARSAPDPTLDSSGSEMPSPVDLAALAARLTALERQLAEALQSTGEPRRIAHPFRGHGRCARPLGRGTRSRRRARPLFPASGRPSGMADWIAGG